MVKNKSFGIYLHELREERNITLETLAYGLCDVGKLSRIETGKLEADKLLRDRLLARLGVAPENYEKFLYHSEYVKWRERQDIVYSILYERLDEAKQRLEAFQKENTLEKQFYLAMLAQLRRKQGAGREELYCLFKEAAELTVPDFIDKRLNYRMLSVEELNLLLEYGYCKPEKESLEWYEELLSYVEGLQMDKLAMAKIYPKAVYYYYLEAVQRGKLKQSEVGKFYNLCEKSIEFLRAANRMFFLSELLEIKKNLLSDLMEVSKNKNAIDRLSERYNTCMNWISTLNEIYGEYGFSETMQDFCYLYVEMESHCIGDVIRIRRKMLGLTMQELSEGICSERTISRLERNMTEPQREIVQLLCERLKLSVDYFRSDLITESPEARRVFIELKQCNNRRECEKTERLISKLKEMISLDIPENMQAIRRNEFICELNRNTLNGKKMDKRKFVNNIKEILEYTIPYDVAVAPGEKYLTLNEVSCLQNIVSGVDWTCPEMEQCVKTLYEIYENQRRIEDGINMYEFVMGVIGSQYGNKGDYDKSDEIKEKLIKNALLNWRLLSSLPRDMYALLWNDEQRRKEKHPMKRDVDVDKELEKCLCLCEIMDDMFQKSFFENKLRNGI